MQNTHAYAFATAWPSLLPSPFFICQTEKVRWGIIKSFCFRDFMHNTVHIPYSLAALLLISKQQISAVPFLIGEALGTGNPLILK
jgi:hypothetical protein